jgi:type I restriction enzyme R subunit
MSGTFSSELEFEAAVVKNLQEYGWKNGLLKNPTEKDLLDNWAHILYENNKEQDRLNGCPLTNGEMQQILEQVSKLRTPMRINGLINGKVVTIKRDNTLDALHFGKEVSLYIYDRRDIAGGRSSYQIAEQPKFATRSPMLNQRRGDVMLLINGMPLIHIELKRSGIPVSQACNQIEKYSQEGVFTGIYSLVQVFVAMEPAETVYFANPGTSGNFSLYRFHWADFNNEPVNDWKEVVERLLSIPMAHQLIGFYTVADANDGTLKVMRSYQYYAASAISDRVRQSSWQASDSRGGYVWHTTGSGKTMTSFKSAQLIASSGDADKVIFLVDRIELGDQSLKEYRGFADDSESVQATEDTRVLINELKSGDPADALIVTSIQKMSNISEDGGVSKDEIEALREKRMVFIVDECHRSTFGEMMQTIRQTFPTAMLFGFTGTPIQLENQKKSSTTADIFGNELHRYSIADGIRDKNILGFDPYMILTYKDADIRKHVAFEQAKISNLAEVKEDPRKKKVYLHFMNDVPMAGRKSQDGSYMKGIEDYLPERQYCGEDGAGNPAHFSMVVEDIINQWDTRSQLGKFHAILATSSIPEAITYYRMFKECAPQIKTTALFDPNIGNGNVDNPSGTAFKEDGLVEILKDYDARYGKMFTIPTHANFKKDVAARLAHKKPYLGIERDPKQQIDLLIVVNQMLTGFDSKWINTLYLDKMLWYEGIIQAFSRTNRLYGPDKPFGTICYYRRPHTMERNVREAVRLYSGDRPLALFVDRLPENISHMNDAFSQIQSVFRLFGVADFLRLPESIEACAQFAKLFKQLNNYLEAAKVQGFTWDRSEYQTADGKTEKLTFNEQTYLVLAQRYKELAREDSGGNADIPFDMEGYLTEIDTGKIDSDYMNSNFDKWLKKLDGGASTEELEAIMGELHRSFASLDQDQQRYADLVIHAAQRGDLNVRAGMSFMDYINEFQTHGKKAQVDSLVNALGLDRNKLLDMMGRHVTEANINEYGRFDALKATVDMKKAQAFLSAREEGTLLPFMVPVRLDKLLRNFIISGGFDLK